MMGSDHTPGVIPLAVEDVFQTIKNFPKKEFLLRVSYMEIYNETVTDLLVDTWKRKPLEVRETINKNIYVADLTEEMVVSPAQALAWIRKGEKNRHYGKTKMNQRSSRSHTIFRMILESRERTDPASGENADGAIIVSHLNLVDLAGSERASQTGAEGARLKEGCNINRSLFTLGQVIKKLTDENQKGFTNYRDSKLTRILQNSLGGNAKTVIICTITPVALDETLSTLQFASTAKKMKNDPHVTEVSDDGALLKRYRNEIVDLKRRLQEASVSSITQTTVTQKEELSQLLQERDQLQREQEDRIRNLTKLIVTSANLVPVKKMPKRRVTWGGKMLRLSRPSDCGSGPSDLSFAEARKRKADNSCLTELAEDDEDFDSHWQIPDEPLDEMEMSQASVTVRSFGDSPKVCGCPDQMRGLSEKMRRDFAETIHLCETLASEKVTAETTSSLKLDMLVAERDYLKEEVGMFIEQTEILEKEKTALSQELKEKRELDEFKSLEEECRMEEKNQLLNEISSLKKAKDSCELLCQELQNKVESLSQELKRKSEFEEGLQSMSNKDLVEEVTKLRRSLDDAEGVSRDTKKEWAFLRSQNIALEETNVTLTANHSKMEAEVNSLRFQLETEKTRYRQMQNDLQKELNVVFDENAKLTALLDGKVPKNLIDSVELERTVANLSKELTTCQEVEATLRAQLEELPSLQALPNKVDNLMKQICELTEELCTLETEKDGLLAANTQCQEEARQLKSSLQTSQDEILKIQADLSAAAQREEKLMQQCADATQQLDSLHSDLERSDSEKSQLMAISEERCLKLSQLDEELQALQAEKDTLLSGTQNSSEEMENLLSTVASLTAERDQLKTDLQENVEMTIFFIKQMIENQEELRTALEKNREQKELIRQLETAQTSTQDGTLTEMSAQLEAKQAQIESMTEELGHVQAERDNLLLERENSTQGSTEEMEKLLSRVTSLNEERDQLQEALEGLRQETQELDDRMEMTKTLSEELERARAERDNLLLERENSTQSSTEEMEKLLSRVTSLSEERDQLQETLEGLKQEKQQLTAQLDDRMEMIEQLQASLQVVTEQKSQLESDLERSKEMTTETLLQPLQEQTQRNLDLERLNQERQAQLEQETKTLSEELERARAERDSLLLERENSTQSSTEEMEKLLSRVASLSEERDQLQETLEGLRQEKQELRAELDDRMEMMQCELQQQQQLSSEPLSLREEQEAQQLEQVQELEKRLEEALAEGSQLKSDLQENVELMIENQEELRASQEKIRVLQDEISVLRSEKAELENRPHNLSPQIQSVTEELERARAERDSLLLERENSAQSSTEEMEKLLSRVTSLSEERDQLQETLEGLRQEKQQLTAQLDDKMETLQTEALQEELSEQKQVNFDLQKLSQDKECHLDQQIMTLTEKLESAEAERDGLLSERTAITQSSTEEMEKLLSRLTSLSEERDQLQETLEGQRQEKQQLRAELDDKMETLQYELIENQEELRASQEKIRVLQDEISIQSVTEELERVRAEREGLLSERTTITHSSTEEMEKLLSRVTSLSEERDRLQETLLGLRQEKQELRAQLDDKMELLQTELQETLEGLRQEKQQLTAQLDDRMEMISDIQEQLQVQQQSERGEHEQLSRVDQDILSSRLHSSTEQLQESFRGFQHFIDTWHGQNSMPLDKSLRIQCSLEPHHLNSLPKPTMDSYNAICELGLKIVQSQRNIVVGLDQRAKSYRKLFEGLVKEDLAVFEERRLQDVLLCRVQAPSFSVKDVDLNSLWEHRLTELLDKRQLYQEKMASVLEKLWAYISSIPIKLSAEVRERERFKEQLQAIFSTQPVSFSHLNSVMSCELERRSAVVHSQKRYLQGFIGEQSGLFEELKELEAQAHSLLTEERSKSATLLQALEGAPLKTELSLLNDNQQLVLQLQQMQDKVKTLCVQNKQLEDAHMSANVRVSNHKQATQLLQTELQDSRAQVEEKENMIQTLRSKLRESEKNASPSATELERLKTKLFKVEVEMSSAADKHREEIRALTTVLSEREHSLRKLKETLRSQQQGEESFLQGEDLHTKLTNPRGLVIKSSILLEKTKLEEEVKQLQVKITELESLVSSQQAEISKWKSRAIKLKVKSKPEGDKPTSPCSPTKRGLPMTSDCANFLNSPKKFKVTPRKLLDSPRKLLDSPRKLLESPRKLLDSPKVSLLDSSKSRFFDVDGSSEILSRTCPKQFFDNSSLGNIPGPEPIDLPEVHDTAIGEMDLDAGESRQENWLQSPRKEDMCKTQ
ncbi:hypothetical protein INR49_029922 [Caranx melampygus]|nr:hypothetical protein INR49_029922 [Caranx melampygus]